MTGEPDELIGGRPLSDFRFFPAPILSRLRVQGGRWQRPPEAAASARLEAWGRALQRLLGDSRTLRPERVWLHPTDHAELEAWVTEPLGRQGRVSRDWHLYEWSFGSAPSQDEGVPIGFVAFEQGVHEPPRHAATDAPGKEGGEHG